MKSELDLVIEYYENEKSSLENLIKNCMPEWDYLLAHYHSIALQQVNSKLQVLYNFKDPDYDRKHHLQSIKLYYDKLIGNSETNIEKERLLERLKKIDQELLSLSQVTKISSFDGQEIDDAIFNLVEGRVKGFKFHLNKESNFYLDFKIENIEMIISFTPIQEITEEYLLTEDTLPSLEAIGFTLNETNNKVEFRYQLTRFRNAIDIKTILSRIVFEAFYYKRFDDPAYIELY